MVKGGRTGAGTVEVLRAVGVPCRTHACRYSSFISTTRVTSGLNLSRTNVCGAVAAINGDNKCCIFIMPVSSRVSFGGTTGTTNRGSVRVLRLGSLAGIANCVENNYASVNVGGRCPAFVRRTTGRRSGVAIDKNELKLRVALSPSSLYETTGTRCTSVVGWLG